VTSSRGYALLFEGSGTRVSKACVLNLALASVPADGLCPANALASATYSYEPGGRLAGATGPDNATSGFAYSAPPEQAGAMSFVKPGQAAPWLTNQIGHVLDEEYARQEIVAAQAFADGQTYSYAFGYAPATNNRPQPNIAGGSYTDAESRTTAVLYDFPLAPGSGPTTHCVQRPCYNDAPDGFMNYIYQQTPGPAKIVDPLGHETVMDYCDPLLLSSPPPYGGCAVYPLQWSVDPEGIKTVLGYDGQKNITKATRYPKPGVLNPDGSTAAPIVTEAGYDLVNPKVAGKPLWIRDPNGNTTTWTYAPEHGGVLTETGPAVNGITPQKRNAYVQRHARLWDGSAAGPAVWLLAQSSTCRTGNPSGAGCALGAADEVVTAYDYGPDSGPSNLRLLGQAVTADGQTLRTCHAYDTLGRKISETSPGGTAGLASCPGAPPTSALPFTTSTRYDADGRVTRRRRPASPSRGPQQLRPGRASDPCRGRGARRLAVRGDSAAPVERVHAPQDRRHGLRSARPQDPGGGERRRLRRPRERHRVRLRSARPRDLHRGPDEPRRLGGPATRQMRPRAGPFRPRPRPDLEERLRRGGPAHRGLGRGRHSPAAPRGALLLQFQRPEDEPHRRPRLPRRDEI
jgi:YD repeat-containing protein